MKAQAPRTTTGLAIRSLLERGYVMHDVKSLHMLIFDTIDDSLLFDVTLTHSHINKHYYSFKQLNAR